MPKNHVRTKIPKDLRRNPTAPHVKAYAAYRARKGKPKALLQMEQRVPLTLNRYKKLMEDYEQRVEANLRPQEQKADRHMAMALDLLRDEKDPEMRRELERALLRLRPLNMATVSPTQGGYLIAKEIISDWSRTKGLRVLGFGVGYGQLLFFLKNFMGAKVKGVELGTYSESLTKRKKLRVRHGIDWNDPSIKRLGKFDITYSLNAFDRLVINPQNALDMLESAAALTKKSGKSYHVVARSGVVPLSDSEIESKGFKIEKKEEKQEFILIKLTKVRD